jgi:hypothetical protein
MSKIIPLFRGKIENGKPKLYQKELFELYLGQFKENDEIKYTISKYSKARSNSQNSYLWGVVYNLLSNETGYTCDEIHDAMKYKFLTISAKPLMIVRSTASLSTVELEEYTENIRR